MNGIHDLGGMHGMGPIQPEKNEPVFHARWEARVFAIVRAMGAWRKWNIDASRYQRELIPPAEWLRMSYYEKWLAGLIELMVDKGLVTRAEIETGRASAASSRATPALTPEAVPALTAKGSPYNRRAALVPRFKPGQTVRARNINPLGHTRLPRYVRAKSGTIDRIHGIFVFPDTNAHFKGEHPQYLYSVRFSASELWGDEAATRDSVYVDLWDDYLEAA
ncbi:MAG TPA: nitrile hydratase subunit beta [Steroidobacteraceae bacterium]